MGEEGIIVTNFAKLSKSTGVPVISLADVNNALYLYNLQIDEETYKKFVEGYELGMGTTPCLYGIDESDKTFTKQPGYTVYKYVKRLEDIDIAKNIRESDI